MANLKAKLLKVKTPVKLSRATHVVSTRVMHASGLVTRKAKSLASRTNSAIGVRAGKVKVKVRPYVPNFVVKLWRKARSLNAKLSTKFHQLGRRQQMAIKTVSYFLLLLLVVGVALLIVNRPQPSAPEKPKYELDPTVTRFSTEQPDEVKPGDDYVWPGKPSEPKRIMISSIQVNAYIQKVGVDQNSLVATPSNIHMGGWFVDTVLPGSKGLSIIDGHVDGKINEGIFFYLDKVKPGDMIQVEMGDGSVKNYKVFDTKTVPTAQAAAYLFNQDSKIKNQLNLITCVGTYVQEAKSYDHRVIVYSGEVD